MMIYQIYVLDERGNALSLDWLIARQSLKPKKKPPRWWTNIQWNFGVVIDVSLVGSRRGKTRRPSSSLRFHERAVPVKLDP